MPRQSAEAKSAAAFRAGGGRRPSPPKGMPRAAAKIWRSIVASRPLDFFAPGNLELLATYCRMVVISRELAAAVEVNPTDDDALARLVKVAGAMTTLAVKLRLTVQNNVDRKSRVLDEVVAVAPKTGLLGGRIETRRDH